MKKGKTTLCIPLTLLPAFCIQLGTKCSRCGKPQATPNGLCLTCLTTALKDGEYDHIFKHIKESK
jgi:hypothetical protein